MVDAHGSGCRQKRIDEEVEVFEKPQKSEVQNQGEDQKGFATSGIGGAVNPESDEIVQRGGQHHQSQKSPIPPAVEEVTGGQYHPVLPSPGKPPVDQDDDDQEQKINWAVEQHYANSRVLDAIYGSRRYYTMQHFGISYAGYYNLPICRRGEPVPGEPQAYSTSAHD